MPTRLLLASLLLVPAACAHNAAMPEPAAVSSAAPAPRSEATPIPRPTPSSEGKPSATAPDTKASVAPAPKAAASYVCPMHKEVTATAPGRCTKCGMALEASAASIADRSTQPKH